MKNSSSVIMMSSVVLFLLFAGHLTSAQTKTAKRKTNVQPSSTKKHATGTFEVKITPQPNEEGVGDPLIGRLSMDKQFSGGLTGSSKGQMLGISTAIKESGGYVAAERFTGTLDGKKGSFSLQQSGTMQGGKFQMNVTVVPDSGTDELTGISGKMVIKIEDGKHFYDFEFKIEKPK